MNDSSIMIAIDAGGTMTDAYLTDRSGRFAMGKALTDDGLRATDGPIIGERMARSNAVPSTVATIPVRTPQRTCASSAMMRQQRKRSAEAA